MTREEREKVEKRFDELHKASGITLPDEIIQAMKNAYVAGADYAIDKFAPRWISVEDELPEYNQKVLWCWDDGLISIGRIGRVALDEQHNEDGYITHWMPLPAPPTCSGIPNYLKKGGER